MTSTLRRRHGPDVVGRTACRLLACLVPWIAWATVWTGAAVGARITGQAQPSAAPGMVLVELSSGSYDWPGGWAWAAAACQAVCWGIVLSVLVSRLGGRTGQPHVDRSARFLASRADLRRLGTRETRRSARSLHPPGIRPPGIHLGRAVRGKADVWAPWDLSRVEVWGCRTDQTTSRVVPTILAAPGPLLVTSSGDDALKATRADRERVGRVWVFDVHGRSEEPPRCWWNILSMVGRDPASAVQVADLFAASNRGEHQRSDGYFEPAATQLIALFLLAASLDGRPVTDVRNWLMRRDDATAHSILTAWGFPAAVRMLEALTQTPEQQREGVFGSAVPMTTFLTNPRIIELLTPQPGRPELDVAQAVSGGRDTVFVLCAEKDNVASPAATALTAMFAMASASRGARCPRGRLPVPVTLVLDDAAASASWRLWPKKLSHFGSRGVVVHVMLRSWAQGTAAWGADGMAELWGSAGVRVCASGMADPELLDQYSVLAGVFEAPTVTTGHSGWALWSSVTRASRAEPILRPGDIAALPAGRALVQIVGSRPVLVHTARPHAVRAPRKGRL
ncbi:TraM recognition domain-containing protein [Streptomycetaceae bacterium NBC_01309]